MYAIELKEKKIIKECNHRMDWWIVAFRFYYNKWNDIYSFKYSEIGNSLDGSEDDLFRGYQDIKKGSEIIQIELMMSYIDMMIVKQATIQMNNHFY